MKGTLLTRGNTHLASNKLYSAEEEVNIVNFRQDRNRNKQAFHGTVTPVGEWYSVAIFLE